MGRSRVAALRKRTLLATLAAIMVMPMAVVPAAAQETQRVETLVDGLNSPRGVDVGPDGSVYVVESGTGGDELCLEQEAEGETMELCFGATSNVVRVAPDGTVERDFVTGIPSVDLAGEAVGATAVSVASDGTVYLTIGLGDSAAFRDDVAGQWAPAAMFGTVVEVTEEGELEIVADIAQWEFDNNPDEAGESAAGFPGTDSNPNGVHATDDTVYVADAGGNTILAVDRATGGIELAALSEARLVTAPPFVGGGEIPMQSVPTSVTESPEGDIVFTELTGFPFPVGGANVLAVSEDANEPTVVAEGFTATMSADYRNDELFVLEFAHAGLLLAMDEADPQPAGDIIRQRANGSRVALLRDTLQLPGGMAIDADGMVYVSSGAVFPGGGSLVRFDPSQAADPAIQAACAPDEVAGAMFSDILGTTHEEAIHCLAGYEVATGRADGTFDALDDVTRGQFAATLARLIRATGTELADGDADAFSDVAGTTHEADIAALAEAGLVSGFADGTFRPAASISRAQAASIAVEAYALVAGDLPDAGGDAFDDDDGSVHEDAIDRAAAAGWLNGVSETQFAPGEHISRGQTASVLARIAASLAADGHL